jgi:MFS transporter, MCT family, aspergillic acid transporter
VPSKPYSTRYAPNSYIRSSIGIFQEYYRRVPLQSLPTTTVSWIGALENFFLPFCSPFVGIMFDRLGPTWPLLCGTFLHVFGLMMASISTKYYQLLLSQGVCSAIGMGFIFNPAAASVPMWFKERRPLAIAVSAIGAPIGGILFPIIVNRLIDTVGFGWTMRVCAFVILALMIFAIWAVKVPARPMKKSFNRGMVKRAVQPAFLSLVAAFFFFSFGGLLPLLYVTEVAVAGGMSVSLSQYLVSILNAGGLFGRIASGVFGQALGIFNVASACCVLCSIVLTAIWILVSGTAGAIVFAVFFGFTLNFVVAATPVLVSNVSEPQEMGLRVGIVWGVSSIGAISGIPIGSSLIHGDDYLRMKIFAGVIVTVASFCFASARFSVGGSAFLKKV